MEGLVHLYLVVGAAGQHLGDVGPLVAHRLVRVEQRLILRAGPLTLVDIWVEVVVPPLPALLSRASGKRRGDDRPRACAVLADKLCDFVVLC